MKKHTLRTDKKTVDTTDFANYSFMIETAEITMKLDNASISIVMQVTPPGAEPEEQKNTEKSLLLAG